MNPKIGLFGLGSIGCSMAEFLLDSGYDITAAIDIDPGKMGEDLGSLLGREKTGTLVAGEIASQGRIECDLVIHSTCSRFRDAFPQIADIVESGIDVISTCEELSYPYLRNTELSERLDLLARDREATVLGTGVNPGFLLDALPVFLTKACKRVESVTASRVVEASLRREPLQRKIGLGMEARNFRKKTHGGEMGHIGLFESCALIATALGMEMSKINQEISPVLAENEIETSFFRIPPGRVRGLKQELEGSGNGSMIRIYLEMSVGAREPGDAITIEGEPPIDLIIRKGLHGDQATVGRVVSAIDGVIQAPAGLATVLDLPPSPYGSRYHLLKRTKLTGSGRLL